MAIVTLRRTGPPARHVGLAPGSPSQRSVPLPRGSGPARHAPMPQRRTQRQREQAATWEVAKVVAWEAWGRRCALHGHHLPWAEMHGHHRLMRSQSGPDTSENCLPVCDAAHRAIHANRPGFDSYGRGLLIHTGGDPAEVPVRVKWR